MIQHSQKPVFLVGGGVILSETTKYLEDIVNTTKIPVVTTLMGKGAIPILTNSISVWAGCTALMHRTKPSQAATCSSP